MNDAKHMANSQFTEYMYLSAVRQICKKILQTTKNKAWIQRLKTIDTLVGKIMDERWDCLEVNEKPKVQRRINNTAIKVYSYDDARVDHDDVGRTLTISQDDLFDLSDAAFLNCYGCPQGDVVKECSRRKLYHRIGLSCHALRENVKDGECEFRYNDKQYAVTPQYTFLEKELIKQLP